LSVRTPPRSGPTTEAIPNMLDKMATKMGLLRIGTERAIMFIPPETRPAAPAPATARPIQNIGEPEAAAQRTDPARQD